MKKHEFIDAIKSAGWKSSNDAQHEGISLVWEKCFPTAAAIEQDCISKIENAFMSGQASAGIDPSYSSAKCYVEKLCI